MASHVQHRVASASGSDRANSREIETIVEEFSSEPGQSQEISTDAQSGDASPMTPRARSSLAKKLAKSLGFHSHKDSATGMQKAKSGSLFQTTWLWSKIAYLTLGLCCAGQPSTGRPDSMSASTGTSPASSVTDKPAQAGAGANAQYVSPFQSAQLQPSTLTELSFNSPTSSLNSSASSMKVPKAHSASLDDAANLSRKSRMKPASIPQSLSGDLEQLKSRAGALDQGSADDRSASGILSAKSCRSSAYSLKSMDGMQQSLLLAALLPTDVHHQQNHCRHNVCMWCTVRMSLALPAYLL